MAKLIPSGVVQLPNFAELQYKLNEDERRKQLEFDEFSSRFDKKAGTYLDGDREAVQQAYGEVEKSMTALATDPDNVNLRRKLREAYSGYNEVAGTAQFLADNYRQQWSAYNTNPDQFSLGGESAMDVFNRERTGKRDANQIMSMASNPFTLQPKYKYDMESPVQVADQALQFISRNIKDFLLENGKIDRNKIEQYANRYYDSRYIDPNQKRNAVVYEGVSQGIIGRNGEITSKSDLDILNTEEFAPEAKNLELNFKDKFVNAVMTGAQEVGVDAYTRAQDRLKRNIEMMKISNDAAAQIPKEYRNLKPVSFGGQAGGTVYRIDNKPVNTSDNRDIVGFGNLGGNNVVVVREKVTPQPTPENPIPKETFVESTIRATDFDVANLRQQMGDAYDVYIGQTSVPSQQGFSLEEYYNEKGL
jgi:hypothetical protein